MAESNTPKVPSRPSTSDGATPNKDLKPAATELVRPSTSCVCVVLEDEDVPPVPMLDPESSSKIAIPTPVLAGSATLEPLPRQPSPMVRAEEQELKDVYLAGFKQVEDYFAKFIESLNFYKRKSAALESEITALKESKTALEERIKVLELERDETNKARAERERLKQGKTINKVKKLMWSPSVSKRKTEGSTTRIVSTVEAK